MFIFSKLEYLKCYIFDVDVLYVKRKWKDILENFWMKKYVFLMFIFFMN